uniref:CAP-Gly domain-containing protein n=1 Tax=Syphacia muris TaxID=451379 RepID=A0A0N5A7M3_9BILA
MDSIELKITTPGQEYPYLKRFCSGFNVATLKDKLQLVVGIPKEQMVLKLLDKEGKLVCHINDENSTLKSMNAMDGMELHATDTAPNNDLSKSCPVEKYVLPDEKYNERAESLRAWRKREQTTFKKNAIKQSEKAAKNMKVGDHCIVRLQSKPSKSGTISFIGETKFKEGWWIGVIYDEPIGKNDGSVDGIRYFECNENCGSFVRPQDVQVVVKNPDVEMEEI